MIPGLSEVVETSYCMGCRQDVYLGRYRLVGAYDPDYDPNDDPEIWRHANGYHRAINDGHSAAPGFPEVVTLCGSTRFRIRFEAEQRRLGLEGCIVLSVALFGHEEVEQCTRCSLPQADPIHWMDFDGLSLQPHVFAPAFDFGTDDEPSETKTMLDRLHFRKIDLSHRVHIINVGGYVGTSTAREVYYAARTGKSLSWLEPMEPGQLAEILRRGEQAMYPLLTAEAT